MSTVPTPAAPVYNLERNGPSVAREIRVLALPGLYSVVAMRYQGRTPVVHSHRTLKAAVRRLASLCNSHGPHGVRDGYAAAIVRPDGHVMSYREARASI